MSKLEALIALCCGFTIQSGEHRMSYLSTPEGIYDERNNNDEGESDIGADEVDRAIDQLAAAVLEEIATYISAQRAPEWMTNVEHAVAAYQTLGGTDLDGLRLAITQRVE